MVASHDDSRLPAAGQNPFLGIHLFHAGLPFSERPQHLHLQLVHGSLLPVAKGQSISDEMDGSPVIGDSGDSPFQVLEGPGKPGDLMDYHMVNPTILNSVHHVPIARPGGIGPRRFVAENMHVTQGDTKVRLGVIMRVVELSIKVLFGGRYTGVNGGRHQGTASR